MKPLVLCILDGVGIRSEQHGNAVLQAHTPNFDYLWHSYPHSLLEASGELVGLPHNQMGNSEVGHMNIGAGRIVYQPLQFIHECINKGSFFDNKELLSVIDYTKEKKSKLHVFGLLSDGGIHSHIDQLCAFIDLCKKKNVDNLYFHFFLDGRDTLPRSSVKYLEQIENKLKEVGIGHIATIGGRYYGMDRDNRWDRIEKYYDACVYGKGETYDKPIDAIKANYERDIDDEFVIPAVIDKNGLVSSNDGIFVFNYRPDRLRELFSALSNPDFEGFEREFINGLKVVTMMPVSEEVKSTPAFKLEKLDNTFGEYISKHNMKQLRIAETEKYAHVTYFFDGGVEKELKNCKRILIPSPEVATYDKKPEMSAYEITSTLLNELPNYDVVILNYANGDMVGHTGDMKATIKALEAVDNCLGNLYHEVMNLEGTMIVIADHGNSDTMLDENDNVITSHSTAKVPCIITKKNLELKDGKLGDIAPTMLNLLNLEVPKEMTGETLIKAIDKK